LVARLTERGKIQQRSLQNACNTPVAEISHYHEFDLYWVLMMHFAGSLAEAGFHRNISRFKKKKTIYSPSASYY